ncbi:DNA-binding transcriptional MerR regulator [Streptacidiphilus sp. MAP12-33]|uniref:MerR family transcriptional regulator n=1 Tax=Streptacidiphilus sp. MAP12-33 TaxID=3156266 RepID=UPI0035151401
MQLSELSERSGVSLPSIKYYLREGLLQPGMSVSARKAEYDEEHLHRLRLIRALLTVGGMSVARARDVLAAAHDPAFGRHERLGVAQYLLPPHVTPPPPGTAADEVWRARRAEAFALLRDDLGWLIHDNAPALDALTEALIALDSLGYPAPTAFLRHYATSVHPIAEADLEVLDAHPAIDEAIEAVVVYTVLYEPVLLALRRLAQEDVSARQHR